MAGSFSIPEKIGQLLALADAAGTEAEKQLALERAMREAARHSIDLTEARAAVAKMNGREEPTHKSIVCGNRGQRGLAFYVDLMLRIADANDLETTISGNRIVNVFGMPSDIEVAEAIYVTAVMAMVSGGDEYLKSGEYKKDVAPRRVKVRSDNPDYGKHNYWGEREPKYIYEWTTVEKCVSGMTARQNFYDGFVREVGSRLGKAKREVVQAAKEKAAEAEQVEVNESSTALVLFAKRDEVKGYYDSYYKGKKLGTYSGGSRTPVHSGISRSAGQSYAKSTNLGGRSRGIGGARKQVGA